MTHWKIFLVCLLTGLLVAFGLRASITTASEPQVAHTQPKPETPPEPAGLLVDLGNAECPIGGDKVDGETYVEWNNLRVGFCCPGCDTRFLEDPESALEKAGIEWQGVGAALDRYRDAPAAHKQHELEALRKRWKVIREP
ncbi:MAG: hypothetical protein ACYTHK_20005 [Planctomycetota bacterium]|jgi:hypothetical protein